jgi:hypothetical protein
MIVNIPMRMLMAFMGLLAWPGTVYAEEPGSRIQEARRDSTPAMSFRLTISPSPARLPASRPYTGEVGLEARERLLDRGRASDAEGHYHAGLAHLAIDLIEGFAHIRVAAEQGDARAIGLFYSLGARLTSAEHARAQRRAVELIRRD